MMAGCSGVCDCVRKVRWSTRQPRMRSCWSSIMLELQHCCVCCVWVVLGGGGQGVEGLAEHAVATVCADFIDA